MLHLGAPQMGCLNKKDLRDFQLAASYLGEYEWPREREGMCCCFYGRTIAYPRDQEGMCCTTCCLWHASNEHSDRHRLRRAIPRKREAAVQPKNCAALQALKLICTLSRPLRCTRLPLPSLAKARIKTCAYHSRSPQR